MVRKILIFFFLVMIQFSVYAKDKVIVGITDFSGLDEVHILRQIRQNFQDAVLNTHFFTIVEREKLQLIETQEGQHIADILGEPASLSEAGELLNIEYLMSGDVSTLEGKYYLSVKMIFVESSEVVISKRTKGFTLENMGSLIKDLVLGITLETGIRENPPSILSPRIIGMEPENKLLTGEFGSDFIDLQYGFSVSERLIYGLYNGDSKLADFEVTNISPNSFTAAMVSGEYPSDSELDENYVFRGLGRRMPLSLIIGGGLIIGNYPYPLGLLGINYTSFLGLGACGYFTYVNMFTDGQITGFSLYLTYSFGIREMVTTRLGLGADFMDTSAFFTIENIGPISTPYPAAMIQLIIGDTWNSSFAATFRYKFHDVSAITDYGTVFWKSASIDFAAVFHPGYYNNQ